MFFMLTRKQHSAIDRSKKLSKILAEEIQQIANDYKNNLTLRQIVEKYNIMLKYNIDNEEVARSAVSRALKFLLSEKELKELARTHNYNNGFNTLQNRDIVFWGNKEKELVYEMSQNPKYQSKGKLNLELIAYEIDNYRLEHGLKHLRNKKSVGVMISRLKKEKSLID